MSESNGLYARPATFPAWTGYPMLQACVTDRMASHPCLPVGALWPVRTITWCACLAHHRIIVSLWMYSHQTPSRAFVNVVLGGADPLRVKWICPHWPSRRLVVPYRVSQRQTLH